jgi:hypothetical protein
MGATLALKFPTKEIRDTRKLNKLTKLWSER